jgi:tetratricopeptide (TPR) repeat protein
VLGLVGRRKQGAVRWQWTGTPFLSLVAGKLFEAVTGHSLADNSSKDMSTHALRCSQCDRECIYDRVAPFGQEEGATYAVAWRCPEGHRGLSLDVCPVGPLVPSPRLCLNCGAEYELDSPEAQCKVCGLLRRSCPAALGIADSPADDPVASAQAAFVQGLFRRGIAILNQALQEERELLEAWLSKARVLHSIGYNRTAAEMLRSAVERFGSPERIILLETGAFLWAECDRGQESLRNIESAIELGSNSLRAHYLRGRALALLGRLQEAREEMNVVLTRDPENSDANRALQMIDGALRPVAPKRWWEFWKR